ncbi:hypothetical protein LTR15_011617 [Elasticomyces elasticus]|nr:hypothetical protein LTR15_011617 [Elasticomyces elasticus]
MQDMRKPGEPGTIDLPITTALGLPLYMVEYPHAGLAEVNIFACLLRTNSNPRASTFAQPRFDIKGGVLLARCDGKHMPMIHVGALMDYIRSEMTEFFEVFGREAKGEKVDRQDLADRFLSPAAFADAFERMRKKGLAEGQKEWEDIECPVKVSGGSKKTENTSGDGEIQKKAV